MFEAVSASQLLVLVIAATVAFFALDLWRRAAEAARVLGADGQRAARGSGLVLAAWLGLALLATFVPALNDAIRSVPPLQAALSLGCIAAVLLLGLSPAFRRAFDNVPMESVMAFFYWRAVFGALLLGAYAAGRLPAGFGIPAGLGDMAITMLTILILALKPASGDVPRGPIWLWNAAGLADLISVAFLAVTVLRPWAAQRGLPTNLAMQNFVVPLFVAIHLHMFGRLWREARSASAPSHER